MLKFALTIGYALAVLVGPGVCCCSWVTAKAHPLPQKSPLPAKPVKSCCSAPAAPACETHAEGQKPAGDPAKCPCKQNKKVADSHTGSASAPDLSVTLRLAEWSAIAIAVTDTDAPTLDRSHSDPPRSAPPLGGRALLSAYHILRC